MLLDLNHQSGLIYGRTPDRATDGHVTVRINMHVDAALVARNQRQQPRDYLGGSRVGEDCARKLVYEITHTAKDPGRDFDGSILRIFAAGHVFEELSIRWLRAAGFDLRDRLTGHRLQTSDDIPTLARWAKAHLRQLGARLAHPVEPLTGRYVPAPREV